MFKEIIEVAPQGFCGGVIQAIRKVNALLEQDPARPVTILGDLVHNEYVSRALQDKNVHIVESHGRTRKEMLDDVKSGTVVFTAHGVEDDLYDLARAKNLQVLDASCPFVLKTKDLVRQKMEENCCIFYIGKKGHPEAEAITQSAKNPEDIFLIEKPEDIPDGIEKPVFVTNQTTMSILDIQHLFDAILQKYPEANIHDEICNATRVRQQAILDLKDKDIDALIVVGDPGSNNTRQLENIGRMAGIPVVIRIETASALDLSQLPKNGRIAITSGASTPAALKNQVKELLENPNLDTSIPMDEILNA